MIRFTPEEEKSLEKINGFEERINEIDTELKKIEASHIPDEIYFPVKKILSDISSSFFDCPEEITVKYPGLLKTYKPVGNFQQKQFDRITNRFIDELNEFFKQLSSQKTLDLRQNLINFRQSSKTAESIQKHGKELQNQKNRFNQPIEISDQ